MQGSRDDRKKYKFPYDSSLDSHLMFEVHVDDSAIDYGSGIGQAIVEDCIFVFGGRHHRLIDHMTRS